MADSLLRVFDSFSIAHQARDALLAAGIDASAIHLRTLEDDGGPVQGNFVVDIENARTPARGSPNRQSAQSELRTPVQRNTCLMHIDLANDAQSAQIAAILDHFAQQDHPERMDSRQG